MKKLLLKTFIFLSLTLCCLTVDAGQMIAPASGVFSVKSTGSTLLFPTPATKFYPTKYAIYAPSVNSISAQATLSIGTNSPNYDNILPATQLTALTTGKYYAVPITWILSAVNANTDVFANVTIAATGTSENIVVAIEGMLQ